MPTLGMKIRELRKSKGLTQKELADTVGVTKGMVSLWERDIKYPSLGKLSTLSEVFDVSEAYLNGNTEDRTQRVSTEEELGRLGLEAIREEELRTFKHHARMMSKLSDCSKRIVYATIREAYKLDEENGMLVTQL